MRTKIIIIISAICILFAACYNDSLIKSQAIYTVPDYSNHTEADETLYTTKLCDQMLLTEGKPAIATQELTAAWRTTVFLGFETKGYMLGYDARGCDISGIDFNSIGNYNDLSFDTDTVWPELLPKGFFDPNYVLEYNKNPGLCIRALHEQGITGAGVGIAIIDGALLISHKEYKDNLMLYERIHCRDEFASINGTAAASIAIGKDTGVAPGSTLYYIAQTPGHYNDSGFEFDNSIVADSILRVLEINQKLPKKEKIRVISLSVGYNTADKGYDKILKALKRADEQNVFVITPMNDTYYSNFHLTGLDRDYLDDPDDYRSYQPAAWSSDEFYSNLGTYQNICNFVPIGSRTVAENTGVDKYSIQRNGWPEFSAPWCAGFYALCCQVKPDITPQEFIELVNTTAFRKDIEHTGITYKLGKIINPADIIKYLQNE